jgi:Nif-specific regulatory protein
MKSNCLVNDEMMASLPGNGRPRSELPITNKQKPIIGNSQAMQRIVNYINTISSANATILIRGESGVGKELIAKTIHCRSRRSDRAFVPVDCAASSGTSPIERELFGYEKGAISGTTGCRKGSLEIANGGTLFLEEIGALSPLIQARLSLVIKNTVFERIGGNKPVKVDMRIIAATTQDLEERIQEGTFNKDLYYELNVFPIFVPPLRERRQDVIPLANFFIEEYAKEFGKKVAKISLSAIDALIKSHWPGNIQELKGCIERALILSKDEIIHRHHLPPSLQGNSLTSKGQSNGP